MKENCWFLSWRDVKTIPDGAFKQVDCRALYRLGDSFYRPYSVLSAKNCCLCIFYERGKKCPHQCPDDIFFRPAQEILFDGEEVK